MTPSSNKIMLITYSDSLEKNIADLRNTYPAFDGNLSVEDYGPGRLILTCKFGDDAIRIIADYTARGFSITGVLKGFVETVLFDIW